ncbi:MAG: hypothetical protein KBC73_05465 [Burkholderiaceae bacterium]|nr:hypothetical protein [Burkholderiaceae bacterium]
MSASQTAPAWAAQRPGLWAVRQGLAERDADAAGRVWSGISTQVRTALVMLAMDTAGDPREFARRPWASYTADQQLTLGAIARQFARDLAGAEALR